MIVGRRKLVIRTVEKGQSTVSSTSIHRIEWSSRLQKFHTLIKKIIIKTSKQCVKKLSKIEKKECDLNWVMNIVTNETLSLAAKTRMSAQETSPGHSSSSFDLIVSIRPKPLKVSFGGESFSEAISSVGSSSTEASQPLSIGKIKTGSNGNS